jgi:hypothetical protein
MLKQTNPNLERAKKKKNHTTCLQVAKMHTAPEWPLFSKLYKPYGVRSIYAINNQFMGYSTFSYSFVFYDIIILI